MSTEKNRQFFGARAAVVNRTHRVVREQAVAMRDQKERRRSLWVPVGICSVSLLALAYAIWAVFEGYDITPSGMLDASDQMLLFLLWSLPVTAIAMVIVWFRRGRRMNGEASL